MTRLLERDLPGVLEAGLDLIDQGRRVFMLGRTKRPVANCDACRDAGDEHDREACECLTCHGFFGATADPDRFRDMVAAVPGGLLAMRTGNVSGAGGIVVVDIDLRHNGRIIPALMPPTATVDTTGGWHLHYWHSSGSIPNSAGRLGPGIDVRGAGGYVVCPPSIHPRTGRPYRWVGGRPLSEMPPALVEACLPPTPAATATTTTRSTSTKAAEGISCPDRLLAAHLDAVRRAPEGRRRVTLYGAARGVARMVAAGAVSTGDAWRVLTEAGRAAGQTERETRRAIEGGFSAEGVRA